MIVTLEYVSLGEIDSAAELAVVRKRLRGDGEGELRCAGLEWMISISGGAPGAADVIWRPLFSASEAAAAPDYDAKRRLFVYGGLRRHGFMAAFCQRKTGTLLLQAATGARSTKETFLVEKAIRDRADRCHLAGLL